MKILDKIKSIFNDKQRKQLEDLLLKKISNGNIPWKDIYVDIFNKKMSALMDKLTLKRIIFSNKINPNLINDQMEDVELSVLSLLAQSEEIDKTLARHEMFRKDDVKAYF